MKNSNLKTARPLHWALLPVVTAAMLVACGGGGGDSTTGTSDTAAPTTPSYVDTATAQDETSVKPFVDYFYTNRSDNNCYADETTNAAVRLLKGMFDIWEPLVRKVDANGAITAGGCTAVAATVWTGTATTGGTIVNTTVHNANLSKTQAFTTARGAPDSEAEQAAYLDDRRSKGYSINDGLGPLQSAWLSASGATSTAVYSNSSLASSSDSTQFTTGGKLPNVQTFLSNFASVPSGATRLGLSASGFSGNPGKYFFKYQRPYRWLDARDGTTNSGIAPSLVAAVGTNPKTDAGTPSGHTAEAVRDSFGYAYLFPERFQEMVARGLELGENRIVAGMHSPLDVIAGRMLGTASAAASLYNSDINGSIKTTAYNEARTAMMSATGKSTWTDFYSYAKGTVTTSYASNSPFNPNRFSDWSTNQTKYNTRLTFGFSQIGTAGQAANVPKGAEVLLETRLPYLTADQRRVVLKTTALDSGYPLIGDDEGWGRLNYFAAADGYGAFNGSVVVNMDASNGGFSATDTWRNTISGTGKLTKQGTGALAFTGTNTWSGGTELQAGTLEARSTAALGSGDVYMSGGTVLVNLASGNLAVGGRYVQLAGSTALQVNMSGATAGGLVVSGKTVLTGGTLTVNFQSGYSPNVGDTLTIITANGGLSGTFSTVTVTGHSATVSYAGNKVTVTITS